MWSRHGSPRSCGIQAHDQTGPPCLPAHHPPLLRSPIGWPRPPRWHPTSAIVCSTTSPRSPTPDTGAADGTHWSRVLGVAVCAVLAGARSLAAIGEWAADAPGPVLAALGVRRDPLDRRLAGHQGRRPCAACWPASTPTRWTAPSALGWPASSHHPHPATAGTHRRGGRSRSTARPCAAAATTATRRCTCSR